MKLLKHLCCIPVVLGVGMFFSSCLSDDKPDGFYSTLGTVTETGRELLLESDSYGLLKPTNPNWFVAENADSVGQRVLAGVQFYEGEEKNSEETPISVQIVELYKVLTKKVDDVRNGEEDIYGNDPIVITAASVTKEHLNIQFELASSNSKEMHRISLVLTDKSVPDENGILPIEFRHSAEGYAENRDTRGWGIASYTLESIDEKFPDTAIKGFKILYNDGSNAQAQYLVGRKAVTPLVVRSVSDFLMMHSF